MPCNIDYGVQIICFAIEFGFLLMEKEKIQWNFISIFDDTVCCLLTIRFRNRIHGCELCTWLELVVDCQMCTVFVFIHFRLNYFMANEYHVCTAPKTNRKWIYLKSYVHSHMPHTFSPCTYSSLNATKQTGQQWMRGRGRSRESFKCKQVAKSCIMFVITNKRKSSKK